jgi:hypothetical protein
MPTVDALEKAFGVYFAEIERCRREGTYWALLHILVSLPDICGALESENGHATGDKHIAWCRSYCPCPAEILEAEDYREIRNIVLHQGRTLHDEGPPVQVHEANRSRLTAASVRLGWWRRRHTRCRLLGG